MTVVMKNLVQLFNSFPKQITGYAPLTFGTLAVGAALTLNTLLPGACGWSTVPLYFQ